MTDFSHLHALEERAVNIQRSMMVAKKDVKWRSLAVQLFQTEQEIADERTFLGLEDMSADDLYAALFEEAESEVVREITKELNAAEQAAAIRTAAEALMSVRKYGARFMRALKERSMLDPDAPDAIAVATDQKEVKWLHNHLKK